MTGFRERLARRQREIDSMLCVGLDPLEEKIPRHILNRCCGDVDKAFFEWMGNIVDAVAPFTSMFKPQIAHYSGVMKREEVLYKLIRYIRKVYPDIPIFLDCKRGDIGRTQVQYGKEIFTKFLADGANFNPYMGSDCMESWVDPEYPERAIVGLAYTSNKSARQIQNKLTPAPNGEMEPFWLSVVRDILGWAEEFNVLENAGLVMAAAHKNPEDESRIYSEHLHLCRTIVGDKLWFLIPGIGTQGGFVEETVQAAVRGPGSIAINSSSGITNASSGVDYAHAAAGQAESLRDKIRHGYSFKN